MGYDHLKRSDRYGVPGKGAAGSNREIAPGKRTLTEDLPPMRSNGPAPATTVFSQWNQGLATPRVKHVVGNGYVDNGAACDQPGAGGCFLRPDQRARLINTYQHRVDGAQSNYLAAVLSAEIKERFKKEPEKSNWAADLLLDVISIVLTKSITKAFALALGGQTSEAADEAAREAIGQTSPEDLMTFVDPFKTAGKTEVAPKETQEMTPEQAANVDYLEMLKTKSATVYQTLREDALANASDSQIVLMFEAMRAAHHNTGVYQKAILEKLERFSKTDIKSLGRKRNPECDVLGHGLAGAPWHETKAFWVKLPGGKKRLGIYKRAYRGDDFSVAPGVPVPHMASPMEKVQLEMQDLKRHPFQFQGYVPGEFVDAAVSMHTANWGTAPTDTPAGYHEILESGTNV